MFGFVIGSLACLAFAYWAFTFRVPDKHYGVLTSAFGGRYAGRDASGAEIPWRPVYEEGFYFKWPWWRIRTYSKEIVVHQIAKREFMIPGGSVVVSGVVQWAPSRQILHKFEEVSLETIKSGLDSEVDKIIREEILTMTRNLPEGRAPMDAVVDSIGHITGKLEAKLRGRDLRHEDSGETNRFVFGQTLSYTENLWGIVVERASIDTVEPSEDLKKARDKVSKEQYEKEAETTEFRHFVDRMKGLKEALPGVPDGEVVEAIQVWKGQATKNIHSFRGEANLGGLMGLAGMVVDAAKQSGSGGSKDKGQDQSNDQSKGKEGKGGKK